MFAPRFNSRPVINKKPRRPKSTIAVQPGGRPTINDFDALDAGFEDLCAGPLDVMVAPGVVAHFGQFQGGNANRNYYHVPVLEHVGE